MKRELTLNADHPHTHELRLFTDDHTPYNKTRWQANNARCILEVKDYDGKSERNPEAWTDIQLREIETDKNGRDRERVISIVLRPAERNALIAILSRGQA